jgi:hypothetical protein
MRKLLTSKSTLIAGSVLLLAGVAAPQIKQVLKVLGVGAAVKQFSPQINSAINKLSGHTDTASQTTKVVPILSIGVGKSSAIGAAQVTGSRAQVAKVEAVAAPETDLFGKEIRIRALIPVSSKDIVRDIKKVEGVGVSGIVDLKL